MLRPFQLGTACLSIAVKISAVGNEGCGTITKLCCTCTYCTSRERIPVINQGLVANRHPYDLSIHRDKRKAQESPQAFVRVHQNNA